MTSLIVAIESEPGQAGWLTEIARRLGAELVLAPEVSLALGALGARVPDLILTPPLLGARDEAALAERLRDLGPRAAHTQTLTVPRLVLAPERQRTSGLFGRFRRTRTAMPADGCEPDVFAQQVAAYLQRIEAERAPEPEPAFALTLPPQLETAPEPEPDPVVVFEPGLLLDVEPEPVFDRVEPELVVDRREAPPGPSPAPEPVFTLVPPAEREPVIEPEPDPVVVFEPGLLLDVEAEPVFAPGGAPSGPPPMPESEFELQPEIVVITPPDPEPIELLAAVAAAEEPEPAYVITPCDFADLDLSLMLDKLMTPPAEAGLKAHVYDPAPAGAPGGEQSDGGHSSEDEHARRIHAPSRPKRRRAEAPPAPPIQDEWGLFDPAQCGFAALVAKLEEVTDDDERAKPQGTVRVISVG
jgi:hypothetical protein